MKRFSLALAAILSLALCVPAVAHSDDAAKQLESALQMVAIPAGCFQMGTPDAEEGSMIDPETPVHEVCVSGFKMGKYEVTKEEFSIFAKATGYQTEAEQSGFMGMNLRWGRGQSWLNPGFDQTARHPVVSISWNDATAFVEWLAKATGKKYRLPTEAEWEYAARAGTRTARYWGDNPDEACGYANVDDIKRSGAKATHKCDDGAVNTAPVGSYKPNAFGLYDMMGNVSEWCSDWFSWEYYKTSPKQDPKGPKEQDVGDKYKGYRGIRGGNFADLEQVRSALRGCIHSSFRRIATGFRIVLSE